MTNQKKEIDSAMDDEGYLSIGESVHQSLKVKGSRFLGYAMPVQTRQEADLNLTTLSKKYHDATHVCYAYKIGTGVQTDMRYSDAGEPSGTAGVPIMDAIAGRQLTCVMCVVVRYFGGTKLGTGGLARAYGDCAALTLDAASVTKHYFEEELYIAHPYEMTGLVMNLLSQPGIAVLESHYDTDVRISIKVRQSKIQTLCRELTDQSSGQVVIKRETIDGID